MLWTYATYLHLIEADSNCTHLKAREGAARQPAVLPEGLKHGPAPVTVLRLARDAPHVEQALHRLWPQPVLRVCHLHARPRCGAICSAVVCVIEPDRLG